MKRVGRFKDAVSKYYPSIITTLGVAWLVGAAVSVFVPELGKAAAWIWPTFVAGAIILAIGKILGWIFPRKS